MSAPRATRLAIRAANRSPTLRTVRFVRFMRSSSVGAQACRSSPPTSDDEAAIIDISMIEQENARESPASTPHLVASRLERHPRALGRSPSSSSLPPQANAQLASDVAAANSSSSSGTTAARRRHSRTIVEPLAASSKFAALRRRRPSQRQLTYGYIAILALNALLFVALIIVICINGRRPSTSQRFVHFELATVLQTSRRAFALLRLSVFQRHVLCRRLRKQHNRSRRPPTSEQSNNRKLCVTIVTAYFLAQQKHRKIRQRRQRAALTTMLTTSCMLG